eukprot:CAMPEP_0168393496 /NCGR_PEP_ID=MMETSP0228-20121227/19048_1 /TAXON_ID=133427 /ORGANISM="Protoceratium reticulatum, Strain CCCM 535 (=CCMP 1889)" /LENGTH=932 /DNA_ID=CAMNT_0008406879 /DNA_START=71 /DNA_END=2869 /DNA_ORIENTATION=-
MGCGAVKVSPAAKDAGTDRQGKTAAGDAVSAPHAAPAQSSERKLGVQQEPEKEPGSSEVPSPRPSEAWGRSDKQSQRIRRQRGDSMKPGDKQLSQAPSPEVSPENRRFLMKVLQRHFLFGALEDDERTTVIDYMTMQKVAAGETIFSQGQKGDCCYFIQSGVFTVTIDERNLKQLRSKHTFGELAMLYHVNRTATVACNQEGVLWKMAGDCFRLCMDKLSERHVTRAMTFLNSDPNFCTMKDDERKLLAGACSVQVFGRGEQILREGEVGDWMFIVIEGTVQTVDRYGNSAVKSPGTVLGSAAMMYTKQQISGAKAIDRVTCLALAKSSLERLIGPVEDVLRRSAIKALLVDNVTTPNELNFFKQLTNTQQNLIIDKFECATFNQGEAVISSGARSQLIVVIEGEVAVIEEGACDPAAVAAGTLRAGAKEVMTSGMSYGGKHLLSDTAMDENVVALSQARLHRLGYDMVREALNEPLGELIRLNELKTVLSDIFLFKNLPDEQVEHTVRRLERRQYAAGDTIVQQGEEAKNFYLIHSGSVQVLKDAHQVRTLGRWDYFGERGLLTRERRSATCRAEEPCTCFSLEATVFADIVGTFRKELEHRMHLQDLDITTSDLRLKAVVGRGSFGIVKLVHHRNDESKCYALKCVSKKQVVRQGQQKSISIEREINAQCYHPCIMQFIKTFQDSKNVYFLTEFLGGGDLFYAIREIGNLTKDQTQLYGGSIALALEYLHARGIMYRDLKPENVLLDFKGNAKLVDFGCCKKALRTNTLVGTPEYFAPETILGKGYTCAIDWWALGVMMHEFIVGPLPFGRETEDQLDLFREILEAPLQFPNYVTDETAISIISGLLERTPELRLGASKRGAKEIKDVPYFAGFNWDGLVGRYTKVPYVPNLKKLQSHWEMHEGEKVFEETDGDDFSHKTEHGMEWASGF